MKWEYEKSNVERFREACDSDRKFIRGVTILAVLVAVSPLFLPEPMAGYVMSVSIVSCFVIFAVVLTGLFFFNLKFKWSNQEPPIPNDWKEQLYQWYFEDMKQGAVRPKLVEVIIEWMQADMDEGVIPRGDEGWQERVRELNPWYKKQQNEAR